jgi:hypothetical protein
MMGYRLFLFTYLAGGLTFIPLLIAVLVLPAWYLLPRFSPHAPETSESVDGEHGQERVEKAKWRLSGDAAASGTFAVLRRYDLQAATTALNARTNTGPAAGNAGGGDGTAAADGAASNPSESVYQTMYRSVFPGSKTTASTTSLLHADDAEASPNRRRPPTANVLYIVLRHAHLMVYDSPAQVEVKHVISLAHHHVSLQAGKDDEEDAHEGNISEAELFTKRTAIVLTPVELPTGALQAPAQPPLKPFYLFNATNSEKEDFYHALLSNRSHPPVPRPLEPDALIKLQSTLHSSSLTPETRALNALIGRVFLALHRTESLGDMIRTKLEKKLARIQKPTFIPSLLVQSIHLGDAGPVFSNLKLRDFDITGDITLSADVKYTGGISVTLLAVAKLDLGPRFKARTVDLVLKTTLQRISGTMLLRVKPPPSNRIWFCFETMPDLDVRVEPVVSERKITYGFVLRAMEERVRSAFGEGLVKPNWDDIPMPFADTRGTNARGGIWSDPGSQDHAAAPAKDMAERHDKPESIPHLTPEIDTAIASGITSHSDPNLARVRHSTTMPADTSPERPPRPPKPLRSPSISTAAGVAMDGQNVEPVRADEASSLKTPQKRTLFRSRTSLPPQAQKDAVEELRGLHVRAEQAAMTSKAVEAQQTERRHSDPADVPHPSAGEDSESVRSVPTSEAPPSDIASTTRTFSIRSTESDHSTAATSMSSTRNEQLQQKKSTIIAATAAATAAAKNWGWNAIQRGRARAGQTPEPPPQQPMGRGQPLPPPGQPLPGPQKGIWGIGTMRRKPVPEGPDHAPPRPTTGESLTKDGSGSHEQNSTMEGGEAADEEEFEPWQENSGSTAADQSHGSSRSTVHLADSTDIHARPSTPSSKSLSKEEPPVTKPTHGNGEKAQAKAKKTPPPLPARRQHGRGESIPSTHFIPSTHSTTTTTTGPSPSSSSTSTSSQKPPPLSSYSDDLLSLLPAAAAAPGLRVPEPAATAIAAENLTPALAHGSRDDVLHFAPADAVETHTRRANGAADSTPSRPFGGRSFASGEDFAGGAGGGAASGGAGVAVGTGTASSTTPAGAEIRLPPRAEVAPDVRDSSSSSSSRVQVASAPVGNDPFANLKLGISSASESDVLARTTTTAGVDDDEILSRVRARIRDRTPAVEREGGGGTSGGGGGVQQQQHSKTYSQDQIDRGVPWS